MSLTDNLQYPDIFDRLRQNKLTGAYEEQYLALVGRYKENKSLPQGKRPIDFIVEAWGLLVKEAREKQYDVLGELYQTQISLGEHGQFFTPQPVADMMAQIVGTDKKTMTDPACGSGRLFISYSKLNKEVRYVGVDLSPICAKMSAVNMWLFDLNADIYHGDSLTMQMFQVWKIRKGGYIYESTVDSMPEPVKSQIKVQAQGTLFERENVA